MSTLSVHQLYAELSRWRVFDCRHALTEHDAGRKLHAAGHVPGALHMHTDDDMSGPMTGFNGRHPLPDPKTFAARLAALGVKPTTPVVAYDDSAGMFSARLWWLLGWIGHTGPRVLLDGGFAYWQSVGLPVEIDTQTYTPAAPYPFGATLEIVETAEVAAHLNDPKRLLLDARAPERFTGEKEHVDAVAGHIPGAKNRFYKTNLDARGLMKPNDVLRREFDEVLDGLSPTAVVHTGGSGLTACFNTLAMEMAGLPGSRIYIGSWSEWFSDPSRPIETGPAR